MFIIILNIFSIFDKEYFNFSFSTRILWTQFAVLVGLCIYLPNKDPVEVETC
jgi:hypothetical protein